MAKRQRSSASETDDALQPSRGDSAAFDSSESDELVNGRSLDDVARLAEAFGMPQTWVMALLRTHRERLEERLVDDLERALRAAGLNPDDLHGAEPAVAPSASASTSAAPAVAPSASTSTSATPVSDATTAGRGDVTLLCIGLPPNEATVEVSTALLRGALAADCVTIGDLLDSSTLGDAAPVPLPGIDSASAIASVVRFYEAYARDAERDPGDPGDEAWRAVCRVSDADLFALLRAANFLNATTLLRHALRGLGRCLSGQTSAELRARFSLPHDMSKEESACALARTHFLARGVAAPAPPRATSAFLSSAHCSTARACSRSAAEREPLFAQEPQSPGAPSVKRGTSGVRVADSDLLVEALATVDHATLRVIKGVNVGMRSAVCVLLGCADLQARMFTVSELAQQGGHARAVRLRRSAAPDEPDEGWHAVGERMLVVAHDARCRVVSPAALAEGLDDEGLARAWARTSAELQIVEVVRPRQVGGEAGEAEEAGYLLRGYLRSPTNQLITDEPVTLFFRAVDVTLSSVEVKTRRWRSALRHAVDRGDDDMVDALVEGRHGPALLVSTLHDAAQAAASRVNVHALRTILATLRAKGVPPGERETFAWLRAAILCERSEAVAPLDAAVTFLLDEARAPLQLGTTGKQPLHLLAARGETGLVRRLLEAGADPELRDGHPDMSWNARRTPLSHAVRPGHMEAARLLRARMTELAEEAAGATAADDPDEDFGMGD